MHQADSPSRMCDGSLDEAARMLDRSRVCVRGCKLSSQQTYIYTCLSSTHTHVYIHIDSTSGLVWRSVLSPHTSASSVLPSPLPTRMSLHHLAPSHAPHPISLA
jgi:hypothetical protein